MSAAAIRGAMILALAAATTACGSNQGSDAATPGEPPALSAESLRAEREAREAREDEPRGDHPADTAIFAGGCFWCMEGPFDQLDGVLETTSGFTGGHVQNPTYDQVTAGGTGHTEAVQVVFDPAVIGFDDLLHIFWRNIDPLDGDGQFCDRGAHYRPGIFPRHPAQTAAALESRRQLEESGRFDRPVVAEVTSATGFWPAEEYHQGYYLKNPDHYRSYRQACGRDRRLDELWGANRIL